MSTAGIPRHLSEAELVRFLDREASPATHERWSGHLQLCDECSSALDRLRLESDHVAGWLALAYPYTDAISREPGSGKSEATGSEKIRRVPPAAARGRHIPWLKAAAAVVLVAAPLVALPPVRGWIAGRVGDGASITTAAPDAEPVDAAPSTVGRESPRIRFVPAPGRFTVTLEGAVDRRSLLLERAVGEEAVFESDGAGPETVVSAQALRVQAAAPARLRLALPSTVTDVVIIGAGRRIVVSGREVDAGRWVP